jgi:hypothetical protein
MLRLAIPLLAAFAFSACKKQEQPEPHEPLAVEADDAEASERPAVHAADAMRAAAAPQDVEPGLGVDEAQVERYLAYRRQVVQLGKAAAEAFVREAREQKPGTQSGAVKAQKASETFAVRMRAVEEKAREQAGLSRDEVASVGQVTAEVLSARQLWKLSGGDEAVEAARARIQQLPSAEQGPARAALEARAAGFVKMKEAREARRRYGDTAVDAVLAHEDALWAVQRESMAVMAQVY